jgi:hypothetical protein
MLVFAFMLLSFPDETVGVVSYRLRPQLLMVVAQQAERLPARTWGHRPHPPGAAASLHSRDQPPP